MGGRIIPQLPQAIHSCAAETVRGIARARPIGYLTPQPLSEPESKQTQLKRQVGLWGAVFLGLGSMVGTGVFVSIGIAAGVAGPYAILAVALAAVVAACNGLSSAQLAAAHPVSGGTYEYGYQYLNPQFGFTAGWMFLLAKSASAATAALGAAAYIRELTGAAPSSTTSLAVSLLTGFTLLVVFGIQRSNQANMVIVSITLVSLLGFVGVGGWEIFRNGVDRHLHFPVWGSPGNYWFHLPGFLEAIALMFVAYTGYGRIATLGEEVKDPARTIPRAVVTTMAATAFLYITVTAVAIGLVGPLGLGLTSEKLASPLLLASGALNNSIIPGLVSVGAVTAMLGVLLNLILGLSRVLLAMGRRRDAPGAFARIHAARSTPIASVIGVSVIILVFTLVGDIRLTWTFSAFTVLIYYSITNLAALRQPSRERRYPRIVSITGLAACVFLAFQVDARTWQIGVSFILAGLGWHALARRNRRATTGHAD